MVLTLVKRGGEARSFHVDSTTIADIVPVLKANIKPETHVMTDEANQYKNLRKDFAKHDSVNHKAEEYVRGNVGTQHIDNFWSLLKRGVVGTYHKVSAKYLPMYLAEFQFRYNARRDPDVGCHRS